MGKNKLGTKNPVKSGNPIYKKAGRGVPLKAKVKAKPVKMNLKQIKLANKEAVTSLDQQLENFREALKTKSKTEADPSTSPIQVETTPATMDEAMVAMAKL